RRYSDVGKRLDIFVLENTEMTRSRIKTLTESGEIKVNGEIKKSGYSLRKGDVISVCIMPPVQMSFEPFDYPLDIIYEDDCLAVINKPRGMVTHPAMGSPKETLVNALLARLDKLSDINGVIRPGIVHRLDKDTTGLIVVAKTNKAHLSLSEQIATKVCHRNYIALVDGVVKADRGVIIANIDRNKKDRKLMAVTREGGRYAETHFKVLERYRKYCLMEYELKTGRTHQIRVHSKHIGHPITGDVVYGGSNKLFDKGQLLHAYKIAFNHPETHEYMEFTADLPDYFQSIVDKLRQTI
ncbi:MAG: RluA family pseudouridine synthase, partial [Clostridia bacterium]|nr:RluA family pseudouridine synthase [Clostridia bacterium]